MKLYGALNTPRKKKGFAKASKKRIAIARKLRLKKIKWKWQPAFVSQAGSQYLGIVFAVQASPPNIICVVRPLRVTLKPITRRRTGGRTWS